MDFSKINEKGAEVDKPKPRFQRTPSRTEGRWLDQNSRELIKLEEEKMAPPQPYEPRCDCCNSPYRDFIDAMLIKGGTSYVAIAKKIPGPDGKTLDRRSVSNHAKNHLGFADHAMRIILEEQAEKAGQNYEDAVGGAITHRGTLEVALRKAYEDIVSGITTVEPRDLVAIIQTLQKMDEKTQGIQVDTYRAQVNAFIRAIQLEVDRPTWERIAKRAKLIYAGDETATIGELPDAIVIDAEVISED